MPKIFYQIIHPPKKIPQYKSNVNMSSSNVHDPFLTMLSWCFSHHKWQFPNAAGMYTTVPGNLDNIIDNIINQICSWPYSINDITQLCGLVYNLKPAGRNLLFSISSNPMAKGQTSCCISRKIRWVNWQTLFTK